MNKFILLVVWLIPVSLLADTSDYIWNEQFSQKIIKAEAGNARAQYDVGNMYLKGQGTIIDRRKALEWIDKAAKTGHLKAEFKLGLMYLQGIGTETDTAKAEKWLRKAANKGSTAAQFYLGGMYRDGKYVKRDYNKALSWLKKSRDGGFWKAKKEYEKVALLANQRGNKRASPAPVQSRRPTPAPVQKKARPQAPRKQVASARREQVSEKNDLRSLLLNGKWLERGKPVKYLPSEAMKCKNKGDGIFCISKNNLKGKAGNTTFEYKIIANIVNISDDGEFSASYRNNVISVVPGKPIVIPGDDEDEPDTVRPSPIINTGLQRTVHTLECDLNTVKQISCVKDRSVNIKVSRK